MMSLKCSNLKKTKHQFQLKENFELKGLELKVKSNTGIVPPQFFRW